MGARRAVNPEVDRAPCGVSAARSTGDRASGCGAVARLRALIGRAGERESTPGSTSEKSAVEPGVDLFGEVDRAVDGACVEAVDDRTSPSNCFDKP